MTEATMVVLMEEFHGPKLKRKGADEPELFDAGADDRSGFPLSCRATKMRRLACPAGGPQHQGAPAEGVAAAGQDDVPMCDDDPAPASAGGEEAGALVLYGGGGAATPRARLASPRAAGWTGSAPCSARPTAGRCGSCSRAPPRRRAPATSL